MNRVNDIKKCLLDHESGSTLCLYQCNNIYVVEIFNHLRSLALRVFPLQLLAEDLYGNLLQTYIARREIYSYKTTDEHLIWLINELLTMETTPYLAEFISNHPFMVNTYVRSGKAKGY